MAIPSLSYDPATERDIYPGAIDIKAAAKRPAPGDHNSVVNKQVAMAVNPENIGAVKTHTSFIWTFMWIKYVVYDTHLPRGDFSYMCQYISDQTHIKL